MTEPVKDLNEILSTRRALLGDPLSVQVYTWLRPVYLEPPGKFPTAIAKTTIAGMVSVLEPMVKKEGKLGTALHSVSKFISTPVGPQYVKAFEAIKRPKSSLLGTFVSVVYARALLLLAASAMEGVKVVAELKDILGNPATFVEKYLAAQGKLGEHFVGHMVTTAEIEAQLDPHFDKVLRHTGELFVKAHRPSQDMRNPLTDLGARVELLGGEDHSAWWRLPTSLAFAMTVWDQDA
jgi:hypothetical protein